MNADKERAAFEHEMRCEEEWGHVSLTKDKHGAYRNHNTEKMWSVWKARAAVDRASQEQQRQLEAVPDGFEEARKAGVFAPPLNCCPTWYAKVLRKEGWDAAMLKASKNTQ